MMAVQQVAVHGLQYRDVVLIHVSIRYSTTRQGARVGSTEDGVRNGEELAADECIATGKNSATGG